MNIVKGLITKDLLQLKSYRKTLIMFIIIFVSISISQETTKGIGGMLVIMLTLGLGMFAVTTFNYDESAKADKYILTLPLTRKEIVLSKYVLVICATTIGSIIGMIASGITTFAISKQMPNIEELLSFGLGAIFGIGIVESIQIPCIYKYGAEKGRLQIFIIAGIGALLIGGLFLIGEKLNLNLPISSILNFINNFWALLLLLGIIITYYISFKISNSIYSKKEI